VKLKLQVQKISFAGSGRTGAETTIGRKELTACPTTRSADDFTRLEPSAVVVLWCCDQYNSYSLNGAVLINH
jgi:hypothetical protein